MKYFDTITLGFYEENADGRIQISDEDWKKLLDNQSKGGKIQLENGNVVCTLPSDDEISEAEKQLKKDDLLAQIEAIDIKSIRALREGGVYDSTSGKTYLQYYTEQIADIRSQLAAL